jgi:adenine-specific DNA-methyltransferase
MNPIAQNIEKLKELFPEVLVDGHIDFEMLHQLLTGNLPSADEQYGLHWPGKSEMLRSLKNMHEDLSKTNHSNGFRFPEANNLLIEGDNLQALKLLANQFSGKVKMIYIDPPYNTGNDSFAYSDNFAETREEYLKKQGKRKKSNQINASASVENGRLHASWLSMMYPRLFIARQLLTDDGAIFVSIDNNEAFNLKLIMDEIFGEKNFVGEFIWHNRTTPNDPGTGFAADHEFIFIYAREISKVRFKGVPKDLSNYKNPDKDPRGLWCADNPSAASGSDSYRFPIVNPHTGETYFPPQGRFWAFSPKRVEEWTASGKLVFPKVKGKNFLLKKYQFELKSDHKPISSVIEGILTSSGTKEMKKIFENGSPFKFPKPVDLIWLLIEQFTQDGDLVLDFFAGSGTTAHAVMAVNHAQESFRRFILVQIAEPYEPESTTYRDCYRFVSHLTYDRVSRVAAQFKEIDPRQDKEQIYGFHFLKLSDIAQNS